MNETKVLSAFAIPGLKRMGMPLSIKSTTAEKIVEATCEYFNLTRDEIKTKRRLRKLVYPRQCAIYLITQYTGTTLNDIALLFFKKGDDKRFRPLKPFDHTTILHAREVTKNRLYVNDSGVKDDLDAICHIMQTEQTVSSSQTIKSIQAI